MMLRFVALASICALVLAQAPNVLVTNSFGAFEIILRDIDDPATVLRTCPITGLSSGTLGGFAVTPSGEFLVIGSDGIVTIDLDTCNETAQTDPCPGFPRGMSFDTAVNNDDLYVLNVIPLQIGISNPATCAFSALCTLSFSFPGALTDVTVLNGVAYVVEGSDDMLYEIPGFLGGDCTSNATRIPSECPDASGSFALNSTSIIIACGNNLPLYLYDTTTGTFSVYSSDAFSGLGVALAFVENLQSPTEAPTNSPTVAPTLMPTEASTLVPTQSMSCNDDDDDADD